MIQLSEILPHLIYDFKHESDLLKAIEEVSFNFTQNRQKINDYLNDPRLVSAYTVFYLLTNIPKLESVLKWMPPFWVEKLKDCDFIDLGAGPGTYSLAWLHFGNEVDFYQIEKSPLMQEQSRKLWLHFSEKKLFQGSSWGWNSTRPKFLFFGHSANEMNVEEIINYINAINPEHILFIEPGTKDFFSKMLEIRQKLIDLNFNILFPCPNSSPCPLEKTKDWCHQFIYVQQNSDIERISQKVKKDRKLLPLTVAAFSKKLSCIIKSDRVVRVLPETKYSFELVVCHQNRIEALQVQKRSLNKNETKKISQIMAGDAIEKEVLKELTQYKRVNILKIN